MTNPESMNNENLRQCVSCGTNFHGKYCHNCGEKRVDYQERSLKYFLGQLLNAITFSDTKLLKSLKYLLFKPGFLAKEYIDGRRNLYTKPLALFFIINLVYFLAQPVDTFYTGLYSQAKYQTYSSITIKTVKSKMAKDDISFKELAAKYDKAAVDYSKTLLILIVFLFTIPLGILFWSRKQYYFNHVIFSLSYISFVIFGLMIVLAALGRLIWETVAAIRDVEPSFDVNSAGSSGVLLGLLFLWLVFGLRRFYQQKYLYIIPKALALMASTVAVVIGYRFIMFYIVINLV